VPSPPHTTAALLGRCSQAARIPSQVPRLHEALVCAIQVAFLIHYSLLPTTAAPTRRKGAAAVGQTSPCRSPRYSERFRAPHLSPAFNFAHRYDCSANEAPLPSEKCAPGGPPGSTNARYCRTRRPPSALLAAAHDTCALRAQSPNNNGPAQVF
jgi:hypothetical protein